MIAQTSRPNREGSFKGRNDQARPARGGKPAFGDKPARGGKPAFGDKPARGGKPAFGDKPARGSKPFGSKPAFNKRPNFGDKPSAQKPSSDRGDGGAKRASPTPKKRVGAARPGRNATPQGGQGTLKRRR